MRQIFHSGASSLIQRFELAIRGNYECHFYKPSYGVDSSLDVIPAFRHRPYPLVGTYLHGNDPSDQMFCIIPHLP